MGSRKSSPTGNNDVERGTVSNIPAPSYSTTSDREPNYNSTSEISRGYATRFRDSFKRDENQTVTPRGAIGANGQVYDPKSAAIATATSSLQRNLKGRHLQMIAIGGSIGNSPCIYFYFNILTYARDWPFCRVW